jgi:hypothetical protein
MALAMFFGVRGWRCSNKRELYRGSEGWGFDSWSQQVYLGQFLRNINHFFHSHSSIITPRYSIPPECLKNPWRTRRTCQPISLKSGHNVSDQVYLTNDTKPGQMEPYRARYVIRARWTQAIWVYEQAPVTRNTS